MLVSPQPKMRKVLLQYIEALILVTHNSSKSCMSEEKISMLSSKQNGVDNQVIVLVSISIKKLSLMPRTPQRWTSNVSSYLFHVTESLKLSESLVSYPTHGTV